MNWAIGQIDSAVLIFYMVAVVAFGLWVGRGQRDLAGYLLGGRNLAWWVVLLSIVATETSTVTFLSVPGNAFVVKNDVVRFDAGGNIMFLQLALGFIVGRFVIVFLFLPHYFRGELFTAYQVLDRRFGGATKQTASLLFLVTRNLADGLRLYLTAVVLQHVVGLELWICIAMIGVTTIFYTFVGGMKSVAFNDCVQFVVYMVGAVLAAAVILQRLPGGWAEFIQFGQQEEKFRLLDFSFDFTRPYTFWSGLVGGSFLALATHGTDQMMVQRYLASGSRNKAACALAASGFVIALQFTLFLLIGVGLACYYQAHPPEVAFARTDEVFARFIVDHLPMGVLGITLAAVFSAAMSTLSSSLNSSATAAVNDFYLPRLKTEPSAGHLLWVSRGLTVAFGLIQIGVGIAGQGFQRSVLENVLAIAGFTAGPVLGLFCLGVLTRRVTSRSALIGLAGGLGTSTAVWYATKVAWPWYAIVGASATVAVALAAHVLTPNHREIPSVEPQQ